MTEIVSTDQPVLLDMTQYNSTEDRTSRFLLAGYAGLFAVAVLGGIEFVRSEYRIIPMIAWLAIFIGYTVWFVVSNMKSDRLYAESVSASSAAISSLVFKKYGLELVDPIKFDNRRQVVADDSPKKPKVSFQISQTPIRAVNITKGRSFEVLLTLSADRRDVTVSELTPARLLPLTSRNC